MGSNGHLLPRLYSEVVAAYEQACAEAEVAKTEYWLAPTVLTLDVDVDVRDDGTIWPAGKDSNGKLKLRFERNQNAEAVRLELDEENLLDGFARESVRADRTAGIIANARQSLSAADTDDQPTPTSTGDDE